MLNADTFPRSTTVTPLATHRRAVMHEADPQFEIVVDGASIVVNDAFGALNATDEPHQDVRRCAQGDDR